jgi:hypothetical protein
MLGWLLPISSCLVMWSHASFHGRVGDQGQQTDVRTQCPSTPAFSGSRLSWREGTQGAVCPTQQGLLKAHCSLVSGSQACKPG